VGPGHKVRFGSVTFVLTNGAADGDEPDSDEETASGAVGAVPSPPVVERLDLSPAQQKVFLLLLDAYTEKQIATKLDLSPHTVHNHVKAIYRAFAVHSRVELLVRLPGPSANITGTMHPTRPPGNGR
jgi:DNA-binding CsgD family transcriptional regulator